MHNDELHTPKHFGLDVGEDAEPFPFASVGGDRWNGWYDPYVTREVAEAVVAYLNALPDNPVTYRFDGDDIVQTSDDVEGEYRQRPNLDGTYGVGLGLCWVTADQYGAPIGTEARCFGCGESFNPTGEDEVADGLLIHFVKADGSECGEAAEVIGSWSS